MKTLVLGASGATGKLVVQQLVKRKIQTRIVVKKSAILPRKITEKKILK
jgi:uncharacterized protein YbjT (DUF2867 family)